MSQVYSCEYVVDNNVLGFAVTDADKNLVVFMYQPDDPNSMGGQKLIRKGDIQVGQHINTMFRVRAKISDPTTSGCVLAGWEKRHVTWYGTLDGAFGYLLPCAVKSYSRLNQLAGNMNGYLNHTAGKGRNLRISPASFG